MKIIAKYLIKIKFTIVEVVELENGSFYSVEYSQFGIPNYIEMGDATFYEHRHNSKDTL